MMLDHPVMSPGSCRAPGSLMWALALNLPHFAHLAGNPAAQGKTPQLAALVFRIVSEHPYGRVDHPLATY